jgi:hypothetical protein
MFSDIGMSIYPYMHLLISFVNASYLIYLLFYFLLGIKSLIHLMMKINTLFLSKGIVFYENKLIISCIALSYPTASACLYAQLGLLYASEEIDAFLHTSIFSLTSSIARIRKNAEEEKDASISSFPLASSPLDQDVFKPYSHLA